MAADIENWDDDADFQGDMTFGDSIGARSAGLSSRRSVSARSESNAADEDWQVLLTPNDPNPTAQAIASAKQVGIPIPQNVPQSALFGGAIKRLGKAKAPVRKNVADEWGDDFDFEGSNDAVTTLTLKAGLGQHTPKTPAAADANVNGSIDDEFDGEWAEGSLGIRFGGTRRDARGRSSSVSAMSPSMGSCTSMTLESEDDELGGLVLPDEPLDFRAKLEKRKQQEDDSESRLEAPLQTPAKRLRHDEDDDDDMLSGLDFEGVDFADHSKKRILHRNVKIEAPKTRLVPARSSTTTLTFTDKSANSRIPRPTNSTSKLPPVYESSSGQSSQSASQTLLQRVNRPAPTTTSAQLLRQKRSAPVLGRSPTGFSSRPSVPFLPAGATSGQSHNVNARHSNHQRQTSEQHERPISPPARSFSRMSVAEQQRTTPSRAGLRRDPNVAPAHLARMAANNNRLQVQIKKKFGTGNELDAFDDLPTSATKEKQFMKEPKGHGPAQVRTLRRRDSRSNLHMQLPERASTATPGSSTVPSTPGVPTTPKSYFTPRQDHTPRFARDTAASRNAREQRLGTYPSTTQLAPRKVDCPAGPSAINWKAQVAARSPHSSPIVARKKTSRDIKRNFIPLSMAPMPKSECHRENLLSNANHLIDEKGMVYNATKQQWEGNENMMYNFPDNPSTSTLPLQPTHNSNHAHHHHTSSIPTAIVLGARDHSTLTRHSSPPRPALISNVNQNHGPRLERGMVFDPERMKWLKVNHRELAGPANLLSPGSVSIEDDEDPFAGIDDLPDERSRITPGMGGANKENPGHGRMDDDWNLGEEFDLGQRFIKRQRMEEIEWRKWTEKWFPSGFSRPENSELWKWEIRRVAERYQIESIP